ncbi:DUF4139 domain-containing protein [Caulobacter henricii]|uniref:DUF4139 domain-containing protein n=1 Tax=Caulobacter henricii TaxID=69395 RepID=A0A0P0P0S8_9CAUL|nr:DUF4139 domain-containing protein [Caulobacter henricii]ALL14078.1 hypothetical protein AQ619_12400 [Caulobacter henricii]
MSSRRQNRSSPSGGGGPEGRRGQRDIGPDAPSVALRQLPQRGSIFTLALALTALASPVLADTIASPRAETTAVTLYRGDARAFQTLQPWQRELALKKGLIMVTETRTVSLPAGRHTLRFEGVADGLIPQSAAVEGLPGGVIERNYDYALLSPGTLLERSLNQPVGIVRTNRKTGRQTAESAIVRQGPNGVVLQTATGVEALGCSGGLERVVFDRVPAGLSDKPSLSTLVDVPAAKTVKLTLSYLAIGVNWQADYVARIAPDGKSLDLTGWLTLVNSSGTSFVDAPTQAVAGKLSRVAVSIPPADTRPIQRDCWPMDTTTHGKPVAQPLVAYDRMVLPPPPPAPMAMASAPMERVVATGSRAKLAEQSDLGDYKLYTLPEPVTVAARQTKQVAFLDQKAVAFEKLYMVMVDPWSDYAAGEAPAATVLLRLENKAAKGLGKALPAGALAVMESAGGQPAFAGEQVLRDVPVGQPFDLAIGRAMDVSIQPRLVSETRSAKHRVRRTYEVDLANAKSGPITIELRHPPYQPGFRVIREPRRHDIRDGAIAWRFDLSPNSRETVRYVVDYEG